MTRGFLKGAFWGTATGIAAVAALSVYDHRPKTDDISAKLGLASADQQTLRAQEPSEAGNDAAQTLPPKDVSGPKPDTLADLLEETFTPAAVPETGQATDLVPADVPGTDALSGISAPSTQAPDLGQTQADALEMPVNEPSLSISTLPAQPVAPEPVPQRSAFEDAPSVPPSDSGGAEDLSVQTAQTGDEDPDAPFADSPAPELSFEPVQPIAPDAGPVTGTTLALLSPDSAAPDEDTGEAATSAEELAKPEHGQATESVTVASEPDAPAPDFVDEVKQPAALADAPSDFLPLAQEEPAPQTGRPGTLPEAQTSAQTTQAGDSSATRVAVAQTVELPVSDAPPLSIAPPALIRTALPVRQPAQNLRVTADEDAAFALRSTPAARAAPQAEPQPAIRINRLPSLGGAAPDAPPASEVVPDDDVIASDTRPPVEKFAASFDNSDAKPLMAIVLMDDGNDLQDASAEFSVLRDLPYPVTIAVDALLPDAAERSGAYRAMGLEVLATVDLPGGATATDAEVNLEVALSAMPEVVGVLGGVVTGLQSSPSTGQHLAGILANSGHGLVTQNRGLNTVQKIAARRGVPSAVVFRDFDAKGQDARVIRRFLDQAAFRAGQEEAVVMLGRLRQETLAALMLWALQDRAGTVAMAPVSAVLRSQ